MPARIGRLIAATLVTVGLASCASTHRSRGSPNPRPAPAPASSPATELSFAFNSAPPANWNPLSAGASGDGLTAVADQVLPSVFTFGPSFNPVLNTTLVQSVTETSTSPQVLVYHINPKAVWSDGVPITAADFVYNWQAQAGIGADVGGHPFTPASRSGYELVQAVSTSPASPDTVTVTLSSPFPDWSALFRHLIPAHIAQSIGFDSGFTDPVADLVSGGPYVVAGYSSSGLLRLVRNPSYWGTPGATLELDFRFIPDVKQLSTSLLEGQVSCGEVPATAAVVSSLRGAKTLSTMLAPGSQYLDLEFQQAVGPLEDRTVRASITATVARPTVIAATVGAADPGDPPLSNRFLVVGEGGYSAQGPPPPPGQTSHVTQAHLKLSVDPSDPVAMTAATAVAQQLNQAGYSVSLTGVGGQWDLAIRERTLSPFPGDAAAMYLTGSATNMAGVSDPTLDAAIDAAAGARDGQRQALIDQVDQAAWMSYADLPLVALPQAVVCQPGVVGVGPNASPDGPAYDAAGWGLAPGGP